MRRRVLRTKIHRDWFDLHLRHNGSLTLLFDRFIGVMHIVSPAKLGMHPLHPRLRVERALLLPSGRQPQLVAPASESVLHLLVDAARSSERLLLATATQLCVLRVQPHVAREVILQHAPDRDHFHSMDHLPFQPPSLEEEIELIRLYGSRVQALSLNGGSLGEIDLFRIRDELTSKFNLPVICPLEEGVKELLPVVQNFLTKESGGA